MADPTNPLAPVTRTRPGGCDPDGMAIETSEKRAESGNQSGLYRPDVAVSPAKWTQISGLCVAAAGRLPDKSAEVDDREMASPATKRSVSLSRIKGRSRGAHRRAKVKQ